MTERQLPGVLPERQLQQGFHAPALSAPPKTAGLPLVGTLPTLIKQQFDFFLEARARYGDIYTLDLGLSELLVFNQPRHAQHILRDNARNYYKGGPMWDSIRSLLGNGLPVSEGDFWLRQRRMLQPQFHRKRLAALTELMVAAIESELAGWAASPTAQPFDMLSALSRITMRVIARTLFGTGMSQHEIDTFAAEMGFTLDHMFRAMLTNALPKWLPVPGARRYEQALRNIDAVLFDMIARTRQAGDGADNLIALLLQLVDAETGEQMTDQQLRDEAVTFFVAGYETTSLALSWAYELLPRHPRVLARLQAEVDAVLGDSLPTFADLPSLPYTAMVVQESMRLRPPVWWIPRTAAEADEIDGFAVPAGTNVAVLTYTIHQHPEHWAYPERFDPERFSAERSAARHKFAWLPFGAGQRQCIGKDFAMMEAQLILAMITQRYTVSALPRPMAVPRLSTTLKPKDGIFVNLAPRERS
jgi:cytochrome P450